MAQDSLNKITTVIAQVYDLQQDEPFKRSLEVRIKAWRSTLMARSLEKHPDQRKFFTQTIYVPMTCSKRIPCNSPVGGIDNIMKSTKDIPVPLRFGVTLFDYVGSINGREPFKYVTAGQISLDDYAKYASRQIRYEYENSRVILTRLDQEVNIPMIKMDYVFDDPADAFLFNCSDGGCDYWDLPYPVPGDIRQMIIQYIGQVDFDKTPRTLPEEPEVEVDPAHPKTGR